MEFEYLTYNGFTEISAAFLRLALIFNDQRFLPLVVIAAILGLMFGGYITYTKRLTTGGSNEGALGLSWLIAAIIGVIIFNTLIKPRCTLNIYDPVQNRFAVQGDIPILIGLLAFSTNFLERAVVEIVDTNSAHPYSTQAGGMTFAMIRSLTSDRTFGGNYFVARNIKNYYRDCAPIALSSPAYNVDWNVLRSGTYDILDTIGEFTSRSVYTTAFSETAKGGATVTCEEMYTSYIYPDLTNNTFLNNIKIPACREAGFNDSPLSLAQCDYILESAAEQMFGQSPGINTIIANQALASQIAQVMLESDPNSAIMALTNKTIVSEGLGVAAAATEWMPKLRAMVTSIVLSLIPILVIFLVTPLVGRALQLIFVLLAWITLWGVTDAVIYQAVVDQAISEMQALRQHQMGLQAMLLAPDASLQALALFGKSRGMGIMISSALCTLLFRMTSPFTSLAANWSGQIDRAAEKAANQVYDPAEKAGLINSMSSAIATSTALGNAGGFQNYATAKSYDQDTAVRTSQKTMDNFGGNPGTAADMVSSKLAGETSGSTLGYGSTASEVENAALRNATTSTQANLGTYQGLAQAASEQGFRDVSGMTAQNSRTEAFRQTKDNREYERDVTGLQQAMGVDRNGAGELLAQFGRAPIRGTMEATGNDPSKLQSVEKTNLESTMNQQQGWFTAAQTLGTPLADIQRQAAAAQTAQNAGQGRISANALPTVADSSEQQTAAALGAAVANNQNATTLDTTGSNLAFQQAQNDATRQTGQYLSDKQMQAILGPKGGALEYHQSVAQGSQAPVNVSQERLQELKAKNPEVFDKLDPKLYPDGAHLILQAQGDRLFGYLASSTRSNNVNDTTDISVGVSPNSQTARQILENPEDSRGTAALSYAIREYLSGNTAPVDAMATAMDEATKTTGSITVGDSATTNTHVAIEANAKAGLPTFVSGATGINLSAGASGSVSNQTGDYRQHDANFHKFAYKKVITDAIQAAQGNDSESKNLLRSSDDIVREAAEIAQKNASIYYDRFSESARSEANASTGIKAWGGEMLDEAIKYFKDMPR